MIVRPLSELNQVELRAVMSHELMHSHVGGEACLDVVFSQIPDSFREEALRQAFEFSVEKMSGQILSEAISAGLLDLPGFTDDLEVAFMLRDKLFSSPSRDLQTGHVYLLKSMAGKLGRDFQLSSVRAAYSALQADRVGAELQTEMDATKRLDVATANLQSCLAFCPPEIMSDPAIGNGLAGAFINHGYTDAGYNASACSMDEHLKVMSRFAINDWPALERIIKGRELDRMFVFFEQFLELLDDRVRNGFSASESYAIDCGFKYAAQAFVEKMGELSDAELRNLVTPDFLDAYLGVDWISEANMHLIEEPLFYQQLRDLNDRLIADPYIRVMLKDLGAGKIQLPQLISSDDFEHKAGVRYQPKYGQTELLSMCDALHGISKIPHLSEVHQRGCEMAMRSLITSVPFYKTFFAEGNELKDPDTMTEPELVRASTCLMGALFNYSRIGPLRKLVGLEREFQFKAPGREVPYNYLISHIPTEEVVSYLNGVDGLIEALLAAEAISRDCLPMLSLNRQGKVFREELGI